MSRILFDNNSAEAGQTLFHADNDKIIIERKQDCAPILTEIQNIKQTTDGISSSGDMRFAGRIPAVLIEKYCNQKGITFADFIKDDIHTVAIMNDPDYKALRIWEGKL